jgi:hypothetical protein
VTTFRVSFTLKAGDYTTSQRTEAAVKRAIAQALANPVWQKSGLSFIVEEMDVIKRDT